MEKTYTAEEIENGAKIEISIEMENLSDIEVGEVVMLFIEAQEGSIIRRIKELKGFERVNLKPKESGKISFYLGKKELEIFGLDNKYFVEPTSVKISVGGNINKLLSTNIVI